MAGSQGETFKLTHPDFSIAVVLSSGEVIATRRNDSEPHRVFEDRKAAESELGDFLDYHVDRNKQNDDSWDTKVSFSGHALGVIKARSLATYGPKKAA